MIVVNLADLAQLCHPVATEMAPRPTADEVRRALALFIDLAACYERRAGQVEDRLAERVVTAIVGRLLKHRERRVKDNERARVVEIVDDVSRLYSRYRRDDFTSDDLERGLAEAFEAWGFELTESGLDELVPSLTEIKEEGGPKDAAAKAVALVMERSPKTIYNHQKAAIPVLTPTAFGTSTGQLGMIRFALDVLGVDEEVIDLTIREHLASRRCKTATDGALRLEVRSKHQGTPDDTEGED